MMNPDALQKRRIYIVFIGFLLGALIAFWPGYFGRILSAMDSHLHRHGIAMTLWCVMMIAQSYLIRKKRFQTHRLVGKLSYLLVPIMAFTAFDLVNHLFHGATRLGTGHFYFMALSINAIFAFLILYGLAIYFRKNAAFHARFMICTVLPLVSPITDRLIYRFFRFLIPYAPQIGGSPIVPFFGFVLADVVLIGLIIWDWKNGRKLWAFPVSLLILLTYHYSVMNFHQFDFWRRFCLWFVGLPMD